MVRIGEFQANPRDTYTGQDAARFVTEALVVHPLVEEGAQRPSGNQGNPVMHAGFVTGFALLTQRCG